jgi:hypothetical protein
MSLFLGSQPSCVCPSPRLYTRVLAGFKLPPREQALYTAQIARSNASAPFAFENTISSYQRLLIKSQ